MIDLHYWPTPNGWKVSIALEEMGLPYTVVPVNIAQGEQFRPEFLAVSPNGRMPAIVDHEPLGGGESLAVFESGAILLYLAEKSGRFLPAAPRERYAVTQWLMWQMGGLGPMLGQHGHFKFYARERLEYPLQRYRGEALRLFGVLDTQLRDREFVCGEYSVADMACWPWIVTYKRQELPIGDYPNVKRWHETMKARPAVRRGYDVGKDLRKVVFGDGRSGPDDEARKNLFDPRPA